MATQMPDEPDTREQLGLFVELLGAYSSAVLTDRLLDEATQGGLTPAQYEALVFVSRHDGCSTKSLADGLHISIPSSTRLADRLMAAGRGLMIVTAHIGNWDIAGTCIAASGYPISAVYEPVPRGWARTFNRYRGATAMETIPTTNRSGIARALLRHRMLALLSDRDVTGNGMLCPAFDSYRYYPTGPAAYTLRLKPLLIVACCVFQHKPGRPPYRMDYRPLEFTPSGDVKADVPAFTRVIADAVNGMIRKYPDQWLVFNADWQHKP